MLLVLGLELPSKDDDDDYPLGLYYLLLILIWRVS